MSEEVKKDQQETEFYCPFCGGTAIVEDDAAALTICAESGVPTEDKRWTS